MRQNQLNLIACEKSTWTSKDTMTEVEACLVRGGELVAVYIRFILAQACVAEWVENFGITTPR